MLYELKMKLLKVLSSFLKIITVSTVNSMCWYNYGQEKEPESLRRLKKH